MFLTDVIFNILFDLGITWLAVSPPCPKCGGEAMKLRKQRDGVQRWHCRECCHKWSASMRDVVSGGAANN